MKQQEYYSIPEAAAVMNIDVQLLRKWVKDKTIEYTQTPSVILLEKEYIDNYKTTIFKKVTPDGKSENM